MKDFEMQKVEEVEVIVRKAERAFDWDWRCLIDVSRKMTDLLCYYSHCSLESRDSESEKFQSISSK